MNKQPLDLQFGEEDVVRHWTHGYDRSWGEWFWERYRARAPEFEDGYYVVPLADLQAHGVALPPTPACFVAVVFDHGRVMGVSVRLEAAAREAA